MDETIIFEQPLNEHIRACLQLERLFKHIDSRIEHESAWDSYTALVTLVDILKVIDRPDLKSKLTKALLKRASRLAELENAPHIDRNKLHHLLATLDRLADTLYAHHHKLGQVLRENELLNTVRQHHANPGGACNFNTPNFTLWLKQNAPQRTRDLKVWMKSFEHLRETIEILLDLTRNYTDAQTKQIQNGFYQQPLDSQYSCELIRVELPVSSKLYPEISVSSHQLSIRFLEANFYNHGRSTQTNQSVPFTLFCCAT